MMTRNAPLRTVIILFFIVALVSAVNGGNPVRLEGYSLADGSDADSDGDGFSAANECDDTDPQVYPGAEEVCDGKDNDCDGQIDEGCYTCSIDRDGDSFPECNDCNDNDRSIYPRAMELCDGKDNDCDGLVDEGCCVCYNDNDRDTYSDCNDCDDTDPTVYPGAVEVCDGKDNDCDGVIDEGSWCDYVEVWVDRTCNGFYTQGEPVEVFYRVRTSAKSCTVTLMSYPTQGAPTTLVKDGVIAPNEVYQTRTHATCPAGLVLLVITAALPGNPPTTLYDDCAFHVMSCTLRDADGDGYDSLLVGGDDCDDTDPGIHSGAQEICDGKDNDCNGLVDEGTDCDYVEIWVEKKCGSTYNDREPVQVYFVVHSFAPTAIVTITDYAPRGRPYVLAASKEVACNKVYRLTVVAKCAGLERLAITAVLKVEGVTITAVNDCGFYVVNCMKPDSDGDGHDSDLAGGDDCDDADPTVYGGAPELCDQKDNDCDGLVDFPDNDRDGVVSSQCGGTDCDDTDPKVYPGAEEIYDGKDNDCDGEIDEGIGADKIDADGDGYPLATDCNDGRSDVNPGARETCEDGWDNNCNGLIDCDDPQCEQSESCKRGIGITDLIDMFMQYRILVLGVICGVLIALGGFFYYRRKKTSIREEVGPPPEKPLTEEKVRPFWKFRKEKEEGEKEIKEEFPFEEKEEKGLLQFWKKEKVEEAEKEVKEEKVEKGKEELTEEKPKKKSFWKFRKSGEEEEEREEETLGLEDVI
ncbi:MAG: putative metal-binding motif-containing protein [Theionarchaea archaeon]|nr:putative metal-binding motif-containing protein [Theionarchaea archaeon]MBU6999299.1 putative metal-binding motif-containing protein [Theionarchaea archaeon]MBU7019576.1 putative metal-binding motif-containing protein [Theionarchaea archaeon]MBU7033755.1 putative metal-binding motif-containing protein [Theionarchaea archaeon]MBU7039435.1 putative metal-binding motif-containing protein [Theionarchaea archaeon]